MSTTPHIAIIGAGFAGMSAAAYLARAGMRVSVYEKNDQPGGRARSFEAEGFTFDMGPSWYWMPEVFEQWFEDFGSSVQASFDLVRLDPSYRVVFNANNSIDVPASLNELYALFDRIEPGSSAALKVFLKEAEYKYRVGMREFVEKPGHSMLDFADFRVLKAALGLHMLKDMGSYVDRSFKDDRLRQILKFPVLFLGAKPQQTPALYSLMNYADLALGTWYPLGGMRKLVQAMEQTAISQGVSFHYNSSVKQVLSESGKVSGLLLENGSRIDADVVIGAADYHHVEQKLLAPAERQYSEAYWQKRTMAPSSLLYYVGLNRKLTGIKHHTLFFDRSFDEHATQIYTQPQWPSEPLFYVCAPSVTDASVAPEGSENLFILIPTAPGLGGDTEALRDRYFHLVMDRYEKFLGQSVRQHIVYKRSFAERDFIQDYNAFKGNAYGLANTLLQTAFLKPKLRSSKLRGLYYAGQLTTPGPGVPPSLISGRVVAREIIDLLSGDKSFGLASKPTTHESAATL